MAQAQLNNSSLPSKDVIVSENGQLSIDSSLNKKIPKVIKASIDSFNSITVEATFPFEITGEKNGGFQLKGAEIKEIKSFAEGKAQTNKATIMTTQPLHLTDLYSLSKEDLGQINVELGKVIRSKEFDEQYFYDGDDLGNNYEQDKTSFRLWAPTAKEVKLVTYPTWDSTEGTEYSMANDVKGTWTSSLHGDKQGLIYTYKALVGDTWNEAVDPYAKAVTVNGVKGAVVDLSKTNPANWSDKRPEFKKAVDAIIYELHLRDLSIQEESGITNKGKFLGATELGTKGPEGLSTGLDYIKQLGVTHVQLLPIYDYVTVDETKLDQPQYNWGYDPQNFNAPEGSYATDPYKPEVRIKELKQMVQAFHDNGLRVIMDVVYNHVFDMDEHPFHKLVPRYYFRYNEDGTLANGTGVGNDVASERKMVQKFIVDSVAHWAKEYHIDGFRFDLMGILDVDTMNKVRTELDKIDPSIIVLGEGWDMVTPLAEDQKANKRNAAKMKNIAQFNDSIRDCVKGDVFSDQDKGFISGKLGTEIYVKQSIEGSIHAPKPEATFTGPDQVVNYVEVHDNFTLWDKLEASCPEASLQEKIKMHKLASSIIATSQGILFIHAGQEFMRTKGGDHNSYKSPDSVNQLDWKRRAQFDKEVSYMRGLIELRKKYASFRMDSTKEIEKNLQFLESPENTIVFTLDAKANNDPDDQIVVIHNAETTEQLINLPLHSEWRLLVDGKTAGTKVINTFEGKTVMVPPKVTYVLVR